MDSRFANILDENVRKFRDLVAAQPSSRVLPVATTASLKRQMEEEALKADCFGLNRSFWMDQLVTFEAWRSVFLWRISEQVESALLLKKDAKYVAAAAVCRTAFELGFTALITSAKLCQILKQLDARRVRTSACLSTTFPEDVELAIFGTRISDRVNAGSPSQKNLLTSLDRLKRHELGGEIGVYYELLCDLSHPSWLGNRPFYRLGDQGTIMRTSQEYDPAWLPEAQAILDSTLSWTAHAARNVMVQSAQAIRSARKVFEDV
jgi:hypothetical protein